MSVSSLFGQLLGLFRRVRVTVHLGYISGQPQKFAFVNVANLSPSREVEVGAVWFEGQPNVPVLNQDRPLPRRLRPDESWETFIEVSKLRNIPASRLYQSARVRLSNGAVKRSQQNKSVAPAGDVPGP
jgi:hypothetical protein